MARQKNRDLMGRRVTIVGIRVTSTEEQALCHELKSWFARDACAKSFITMFACAVNRSDYFTGENLPMKTIRFLAALLIASTLVAPFALADDAKKSDKEEKMCDCAKDKDGKACGVDKDCCCTGKKATKSTEKKG
jgi:hypothetical protein